MTNQTETKAPTTEELKAIMPGQMQEFISMDKSNLIWKHGRPQYNARNMDLPHYLPEGSYMTFRTFNGFEARDLKRYTKRAQQYADAIGKTFTGFVQSNWSPITYYAYVG